MPPITCPTCHGSGSLHFNGETTQHPCPTCNGHGAIAPARWLQRWLFILVFYLIWSGIIIFTVWTMGHLPRS
jgi:hypothetical protein